MLPAHRLLIAGAFLIVSACSPADPAAEYTAPAATVQPASPPAEASTSSDGIKVQPVLASAARDGTPPSKPSAVRQNELDGVVREGARLVHEAELLPLWVRGGSHDDSSLALPMSMAADSQRVVVYDGMNGSLTAYSALDGSIQWRVGRRGKGPDEYSPFVVLSPTPRGEFLALDWQNLRLTYVNASTGQTMRTARWPVLSAPRSACVTADGRLLTVSSRSVHPLIWLSDSAATLEASLPWPEIRELDWLVKQSFLASGVRGDCVLTLRYGTGFALYQRQDSLPLYTRDYVEPVAFPVLKIDKSARGTFARFPKGTVQAAVAAAASEADILVAFGGRSSLKGRLVDRYILADGAYLDSFLLPFSPDGMAAVGGRVFVIDTGDDYPALRVFGMP